MAKEVITEFPDNATVIITYFNYNDDGELEDCTAASVTIIDPDGTTQVNAVSMTKDATGIYSYQYHKGASADPMDKGEWRGRVDAIDGTGDDAVISPTPFSFKVI